MVLQFLRDYPAKTGQFQPEFVDLQKLYKNVEVFSGRFLSRPSDRPVPPQVANPWVGASEHLAQRTSVGIWIALHQPSC